MLFLCISRHNSEKEIILFFVLGLMIPSSGRHKYLQDPKTLCYMVVYKVKLLWLFAKFVNLSTSPISVFDKVTNAKSGNSEEVLIDWTNGKSNG